MVGMDVKTMFCHGKILAAVLTVVAVSLFATVRFFGHRATVETRESPGVRLNRHSMLIERTSNVTSNDFLAKHDEKLERSIRKYAVGTIRTEQTSSNSESERVLNIHIVPHTHDDVGWLKTVDQYYNGWNDTIQTVSVREILTSVVEALEENPSRTFTYVEQKFFTMWWKEQTRQTKEVVRKLVQETKQLTFVNGGWCMHDEAATHYMGMIDQTTLGHNFLKETFGYIPKVGWQLDPFGHSATQASLMTYKMGFDALYFGRIDYQDLELRHATKECEGLWNTYSNTAFDDDDDDNDDGNVFWGLTGSYEGNYGAPGGYCFDVNCGPWRKSLIDKNQTTLLAMVEDLLLSVRIQSDRTKGNHVMLTMGSDFQYQRAAVNFANLDLLIGTVMHGQASGIVDISAIFGPQYTAVNMFYSSPEYYTQCKYNETQRNADNKRQGEKESIRGSNTTNLDRLRKSQESISFQAAHVTTSTERKLNDQSAIEWSIKIDDFFPYSDCPNCFWTGYFTSRPSLKRFERAASSFLLAARQIESLSPMSSTEYYSNDAIYQLEDALGVVQHHDGVSGTSKQHVAYDYAKTLQGGMDEVIPSTISILKKLMLGDENSARYLMDLTYCQLLNETKCDKAVEATSSAFTMPGGKEEDANDLYVIVYNSLAHNRSIEVDLPVGTKGAYFVEDLEDSHVQTVFALPLRFHTPVKTESGPPSFVLSFAAESLPALGAKVFKIQKRTSQGASKGNEEGAVSLDGSTMRELEDVQDHRLTTLSNGQFDLEIDTKTGSIRSIGGRAVDGLSEWGYYTSFDSRVDKIHDDDDHNSGAYIFRPSTPNQKLNVIPAINATILHTSAGSEIFTQYKEPWIQSTTRIRNKDPYIEIEYQVGPIPIEDGRGKEVVTRYNTMVKNNGVFFTDSNGRKFLKRQRNHRPTWDLSVYEPIAGNYYPINTAIYVEDETKEPNTTKAAFAVVTDRTQGGGSIIDGTIEVMVHRRTLADDHRGVDEPMNETDVGIHPYPPYGDANRVGEGIVIRGKHRIMVEGIHCPKCGGSGTVGGERLAQSIMDDTFAEPLVFVGTAPSSQPVPFQTTRFSGLEKSLPKNVMLITKQLVPNKDVTEYFVRLGHQYGESVDVDLSVLFVDQDITDIQETTLSGNQGIDDWKNNRLDWTGLHVKKSTVKKSAPEIANATTFRLSAMDIRTFRVKVKQIS